MEEKPNISPDNQAEREHLAQLNEWRELIGVSPADVLLDVSEEKLPGIKKKVLQEEGIIPLKPPSEA